MELTQEQLNKRVFGKHPVKLSTQIGNLLFWFLVAVFAVFVAFSQVYTAINIKGPSMMPTINKGYWENIKHEDIAYYKKVSDFKYGDIVIAKTSDVNADPIIKRVIGLSGDTIEIKQAGEHYYVFRNGEKLVEPYIYSQAEMDKEYQIFDKFFGGKVVVEENQLFIMGDNRGHTTDSTYYGCFNTNQIMGRVDYFVEYNQFPIISLFIQLFFPIFS